MADLVPFTATPAGVEFRGMRGGEGPVALLLHGTAGSWRSFRPWLSALLPRAHLIMPDLPGFGESPVPPVRPRLGTWARLLRLLVTELEAPPSIVLGLGSAAGWPTSWTPKPPEMSRPLLRWSGTVARDVHEHCPGEH